MKHNPILTSNLTPQTDPRQRFFSILVCALLIFLLVISYPLSKTFPLSLGWENGVVENTQAVILLLGMIAALCFAVRNRETHSAKLGWAFAIFWLICLARELSWGAVFFPPQDIGAHGPVFSSRSLWYKPAVYPIVALLGTGSIALFLKYHLHRVLLQLIREKRFPWIELVIVFLAAMMSNFAESHGNIIGQHHQVLEEVTELIAYLGLFLIQIQIFIRNQLKTERS